jgi:xanthine dehydrogenase accessory factor
MQDVFPTLVTWLEQGKDVAIAIVVKTWGSSPRPSGAWMVVSETGEFAGSVSGGCVESAVIDSALQSIRSMKPEFLHFGVTDETAWEVGLACGGEIDIFIVPLSQENAEQINHYLKIGEILTEETSYRIAHIVRGPSGYPGQYYFSSKSGHAFGTIDEPIRMNLPGTQQIGLPLSSTDFFEIPLASGLVELFVENHRPPPKLIIVGGVHIAIPLAQQAKSLGYRVIILEPRRAFGKDTRFPDVDQVITSWPDEGLAEIGLDEASAVAVLTHDPKIDDPALRTALASSAFYVGALGSRTTQKKRRNRLLAAGMTEEQLDKLHAPIGLNLGGRAPAEIALSIMAEIISMREDQKKLRRKE